MNAGNIPGRRELMVIAFFFGFAAAISQVILIRELLAVFRGNEFIIGIVFAAWFTGIFAGARLSGASHPQEMHRRVAASALLLPPVLGVSAYGCHLLPLVIPRIAGTFYTFSAGLTLSLIFAIPVSFIIGWLFPPLVSLVSREAGEDSGGRVYCIESAGSFVGGIAFSFVIAGHLNPLQAVIILHALSILLFARRNIPVLVVSCAVLAAAFYFAPKIEFTLLDRVWQADHAGRLAEYGRTRYQAVAICSDEDRISVYGDGILLYSLPDTYESRQVFHLIMALSQKRGGRILLFGTGPGSLLYNLLQGGMQVTYCEPDPALWKMVEPRVKRMYDVDEGRAGLTIITRDIKEYLLNSHERFDMIVNLYSTPGNIMLNRYFTREFYSLCKDRLKEGGIMVSSVGGFSNYMGPDRREFILSVYRAFTGEFPANMATSGDNMYLAGAALQDAFPAEPAALIDRYAARLRAGWTAGCEKEVIDEFSARELGMLFEKSQLEYFGRVASRSTGTVAENRDLRPRAYWNHIMLSSLQEKSFVYRVLRGGVFIPLIVFIALAVALADIAVRGGRRCAAAGLFIFVAGFTGIAAVMIMILLHQMLEGVVYHRVALINACFMLGLACGGYFFTLRKKLSPAAAFICMALMLALAYGYMNTGQAVFFWPVIVLFAFFNGGIFPLLFQGMEGTGFHERARVLDSMEHLGAISGSLVTVLCLVPLAGIGGTLAFCIVLLAAAALVYRPLAAGK